MPSGILANTFEDIVAILLFLEFIEDGKDTLITLSYFTGSLNYDSA